MGDGQRIGEAEAISLPHENAKRLRECLTALSKHENTMALRIEVQFAENSDRPGAPALTIMVTHSLSQARELELAPLIGRAFEAVFRDARTTPSGGDHHG